MPHQCVRCNKLYADGSDAIMKGCSDCGGRFFFFVRKDKVKQSLKAAKNLTDDDKKQIEEDVTSMVGETIDDSPVILDFESIRINEPGSYELDLVDIFKKNPLIYKLEDGKYMIDLASTFEQEEKKKKKD